ncbi:hypothetical protein [Pseudothauera rhizosphaerae]|uniref:Uncharacterized protein n=1 Tax=Pseudothauera rhizosphaerae TaxID=2565932 RepID=A0A4S4ANW7_9RHOO|nr:hypothetical protein [Pseudothauera rhizosphaerae]THF60924.1 hypothetical protein E6O51_11895 [Pseudothauera rhizosphaerae]
MAITDARLAWLDLERGISGARAVSGLLMEVLPGPGCTMEDANRASDLLAAVEVCLDAAKEAVERIPMPE